MREKSRRAYRATTKPRWSMSIPEGEIPYFNHMKEYITSRKLHTAYVLFSLLKAWEKGEVDSGRKRTLFQDDTGKT